MTQRVPCLLHLLFLSLEKYRVRKIRGKKNKRFKVFRVAEPYGVCPLWWNVWGGYFFPP